MSKPKSTTEEIKKRRRTRKVKSNALQYITFADNAEFFYQRRRDIETLMGWDGWNKSQVRLLLKMFYDIILIFAAIQRTRNKHLDMRAIAREKALSCNFVINNKIQEETIREIEGEPIRSYHPKFIRRRLMLPEDPTLYPKGESVTRWGWYSEERRLQYFTLSCPPTCNKRKSRANTHEVGKTAL